MVEWFGTFTAETWVAFGAAGIALVALYFTGVAAAAAKDQTRIQRQLRIDAAQPYVWADIWLEPVQAGLLMLHVGNSGPTVATNVRVTTSAPLPAAPGYEDRARLAERQITGGIPAIPPGRVLSWALGVSHQVVNRESLGPCQFTIEADGPFGPLDPLVYTVDLAALMHVDARAVGSLAEIGKAIDGVSKELAEANLRARRAHDYD